MSKLNNFIYKWGWLCCLILSIAGFALWFSDDEDHKSNILIYDGVITLVGAISLNFFPPKKLLEKKPK